MVAVARAYDADIVVGFVAAGILTPADVEHDVPRRLRYVPTRLLVAEVARRNREGEITLETALPPEWARPDDVGGGS